jgi:hypothetical protein
MLSSGENFANGLISAFRDKNEQVALVSLATDGELYGHHRAYADMTLAYCIYYIETKKLAKITNFSEFLAKHPPQYEVEILENTSWSCKHGIERWRSDCGDNSGRNGWNQAWRKPLRDTMDWLRDTITLHFESEAQQYLKDPWQARNEYITVVLDRSRENVEKFLSEQSKKSLDDIEKRRVLRLMELQRHAMLMYTSCGWFFDDISGIESRQVMMYAARALQLACELFDLQLEEEFIKRLEQAPSNILELGNGAKVYNSFIKPMMTDAAKIIAQSIILSLFAKDPSKATSESLVPGGVFQITQDIKRHETGKFRLALGRAKIHFNITLDDEEYSGAAIWLGDHNIYCGVSNEVNEPFFNSMHKQILTSFEKGQINETILLISKHFGQNTYSLKDMFKDDQQRILNFIVEGATKKAQELNEIVYFSNSPLLRFMNEIKIPPPKPFITAAEIVLNTQIRELLSSEEIDFEKLEKLIADSKALEIQLDSKALSLHARERIDHEFTKLSDDPEKTEKIERISQLIKTINQLPLKLNLWHAQNTAFKIAQTHYNDMKWKTDEPAQAWVSEFRKVCDLIGIRLD